MKTTKSYIVSEKTKTGLIPICLVVATTITGEVFPAQILDYLCKCGIISDVNTCITLIDEPPKQTYGDYFTNRNITTLSGSATIGTASLSPSASPSPSPEFI